MIFVTVGTHEQPFNRLIREVDRLKLDGKITEEVIVQTGYSDYVPEACEHQTMMSGMEMEACIRKADIVITHGGPGSIFGALQQHKIPIVVPRQSVFDEHVDMHQVQFVKMMAGKNNILPVFDIGELEDLIVRYEWHIERLGGWARTGDSIKAFVHQLDTIVHRLLER